MQINQPKWFKQKERKLNSTGKLDLSGEIIKDLSFIGSRPSMKVLDLSFTSIQSLEGLSIQPKLEYLILDGSTISSFKNASSISNITKISLRNTPISSIPNYKLSLLLICSKNLRIIDGKIIPERLKKKAETYPPIASKLIDCGWMVEYPCPDENAFKDLCIEYDIQFDQSSITPNLNKYLSKPNDIDDFIAEYSLHHEEMIQRSQIMKKPNHYCSMSVTDSNQNYLLNGFQDEESGIEWDPDINQLPFLVSEIIKKYGFDIEEGDPVSTITASLINIFNIAEGIDFDGQLNNLQNEENTNKMPIYEENMDSPVNYQQVGNINQNSNIKFAQPPNQLDRNIINCTEEEE